MVSVIIVAMLGVDDPATWLREAESALRVAEAAYRFGERGILDVLDAQRVLRGVRADLLQARFQQQSARIALDQLSGQFVADSQP